MSKSKTRHFSSGRIVSTLLAALLVSGILIPSSDVKAKTEAAVKLTPASVTLSEKQTKAISLKKDSKKITKDVTFTSSNKKVATVNKKGTIKAIKAGTAKITAKYEGKKYICKVTVKAATKVEKLKISIDKVASAVRKGYGDGMTVYPDGADFTNAKSRSYGINKVVNGGITGKWTSPEESYIVVYRILEMDTDSKQYQSLKVGQKIKISYKGERDDTLTVNAINHQYVLCVYEMYANDSGKQVLNQKSPFKFDGLNSAIKAFKKIAD